MNNRKTIEFDRSINSFKKKIQTLKSYVNFLHKPRSLVYIVIYEIDLLIILLFNHSYLRVISDNSFQTL